MVIIFHCEFGVSGDMLVGALIDLGADSLKLIDFLHSLEIGDFEIIVSKKIKGNISCTDFDVRLKEDNFDHDMKYLYGDKVSVTEPNIKRNIYDIEKIVNNCSLSENFKQLALKIFIVIAKSEAKAHGLKLEEVVFHETGAMDSIIDIMSVVFCLQNLNVQKVYAKNLVEGEGFINCRAGRLTIPTPAVKNIAEQFNIKLKKVNLPYELITPTGLGIIASVASLENVNGTTLKVGFGAGKRDYKTLGVLKVEIIKEDLC